MGEEGKTFDIRAICAAGFKSIGSRKKIEIRPITVLAGANCTGKSSIIQPLLLLKQTSESSGDRGPLLLKGQNVDFSCPKQFLSRISTEERKHSFTTGFASASGQRVDLRFVHKGSNLIETKAAFYKDDNKLFELNESMTSKDVKKNISNISEEFLRAEKWLDAKAKPEWQVKRNRCYLTVRLIDANSPESSIFEFTPEPLRKAKSFIENLIHVPGARGLKSRSYERSTIKKPHFFGIFTP